MLPKTLTNPNTVEFWQSAYSNSQIDVGVNQAIPLIKSYFGKSNINKLANILIPGAGNAYEAEYLHQQGFKNVYVLDFASIPLDNFRSRVPDFPKQHIVQADFFQLAESSHGFVHHFDYVIEKAFFCAITPDLRVHYVAKMHKLLKPSGVLIGIFLNGDSPRSLKHPDYPPYACTIDEYQALFSDKFHIITMKKGKTSEEEHRLLMKMMAK